MASTSSAPKILVVDEDRNTRAALAELLHAAGYAVTTAGTEFEATAAVRSFQPAVMLSDVRALGRWPIDVQAKNDVITAAPLRILMSAIRLPRAIGVPWLKKPIDFDVLLSLLRQITGGPR